jgi:hypothetical protein
MAPWHWLVALTYLVVLLVLTCPVLILFNPWMRATDAARAFLECWYWVGLGAVVLGQVVLLFVPVRVANRRPLSRRSLLLPIGLSGLLTAVLALGTLLALIELAHGGAMPEHWQGWLPVWIAVGVWVVWSAVFYHLARNRNPAGVVAEQVRLLLKGSVLELLVAVPSHVLVRQRGYCCAGIYTAFGIALGVSVMLFSFGPAVFFLYYARWQRLQSRLPILPSPPAEEHGG